jgi:polyhydroxyalkanoate synthesis regulator phasin
MKMNSKVKKVLQFGVGSFYIAREKTNKAIASLRKEGVFDEKDSREVVKETVTKAQEGMENTTKSLKEKFKEMKKKTSEKAEDVSEKVEEEVKEKAPKKAKTKTKKSE